MDRFFALDFLNEKRDDLPKSLTPALSALGVGTVKTDDLVFLSGQNGCRVLFAKFVQMTEVILRNSFSRSGVMG